MVWNVLCLIALFIYFAAKIILMLGEKEYQKLWYKEKAIHLRAKPRVSNAELCEQYVMFCKRNNCRVKF